MQRRSLIKCILGLAATPKILADINFKPPLIARELQSRQFEGIYYHILANANQTEYDGSSFTLTDLDEIIQSFYNN